MLSFGTLNLFEAIFSHLSYSNILIISSNKLSARNKTYLKLKASIHKNEAERFCKKIAIQNNVKFVFKHKEDSRMALCAYGEKRK